jgi:putative SOS response-associated peptidase YedK
MCNLYSVTTNQEAIRRLFGTAFDSAGNLPSMPGVFPDQEAPVVRNHEGGRQLIRMRWGMPPPKFGGPPVTNIRNLSSPHWRGWLKPASRCLVPASSFSEYAPEANPATGKKDVVWFALGEERSLFAFAGRGCRPRLQGDDFLAPYGSSGTPPITYLGRRRARRERAIHVGRP